MVQSVATHSMYFSAYLIYNTQVLRIDQNKYFFEIPSPGIKFRVFLSVLALWLANCGTVSSIATSIPATETTTESVPPIPTLESSGGGQGGEIDPLLVKELVMEMVRNGCVSLKLLPMQNNPGMSLGSGAIESITDGAVTILTALHVLQPGDFVPETITISTADGEYVFSLQDVNIVPIPGTDIARVTFRPMGTINQMEALQRGSGIPTGVLYLVSTVTSTSGGGTSPRQVDQTLQVTVGTVMNPPSSTILEGTDLSGLDATKLFYIAFNPDNTTFPSAGSSGGVYVDLNGEWVLIHFAASDDNKTGLGATP